MTVAAHEPAAPLDGGLVPVLSPDAAQALTQRIAGLMHEMHPLLHQAWRQQAWRALGYASWAAYCRAEFKTDRLRLPDEDRLAIVHAWRADDASLRDIGAAIGQSEGTVRKILGATQGQQGAGQLQQSRRATPLTVRLEAALLKAGPDGLTVKEVTRRFHVHHGQASPALHALHASHRAAHLLEERRMGCRPYVHPDHIQGRPVRRLRDTTADYRQEAEA